MRVLLVNDTGGRENLGCQLTSRTLALALREALAQDGREAEVHHLPWGFASRLSARARVAGRALASGREVLSEPALRDLALAEYGPGAIEAALASDALAFQPEGTVSDAHGALRILRLLSLPLWAALHGGRPVAVLNGTFPLLTDARAGLVLTLLNGAAHAALRDRLAAEHWGAAFSPDAAVLWPGRRDEPAAPADHLWITTAAEAEPARDLAIGRAALALARRASLKPLVMTKGWRRLEPLRAEVLAMGGAVVGSPTLEEADAWCARCRLHLGGRYHMALLAATHGVPSALVRTNTHKNLWLAADFRGIRIAPDEAALAEEGTRLLTEPLPAPGLLEDVARHRALQRADMGRLRAALDARRAGGAGTPPARRPAPDLEPDLLAALARDARADLRGGFLRRLLARG